MIMKCAICDSTNAGVYVCIGRKQYCGSCAANGKQVQEELLILEAAKIIQERQHAGTLPTM